ncbi:MAG: hypothetical protein Kow00109_04870 [Acidobacteriota bacterium]
MKLARLPGLLIALLSPLISFFQLVAASDPSPFLLEDVADKFPSRGFEEQIAFWRMVLTQIDSREVIFHDSEDLRLIYHRETFQKSIHEDPREVDRQRRYLRNRLRDVKGWFQEIARRGPDSPQLEPHHRRIVQVLREHGYQVTPSLLRSKAEQVRFQRGVKDQFRNSLIRAGRYRPHIEEILRRHGVPGELAALPHIESSYDYDARSHAEAAGIWQFTRGTARSFLRLTGHVDERLDPIRSTEAAARLLRENYDALGNWPLAITAYNYGRNGLLRAKEKYGGDLLDIIRHHRTAAFGFASRNFYPEFLAALEISKNYRHYFGELPIEAPLSFSTIVLEHAYSSRSLRDAVGGSNEWFHELNPHLTRALQRDNRLIPAGIHVRVPPDKLPSVQASLSRTGGGARTLKVAQDGSLRYRVRPGDTLSEIAREFGVAPVTLRRLNGISNPNRLLVGQVLIIDPTGSPSQRAAAGGSGGTAVHVVRPGETLSTIARRYGISLEELAAANGLADPDHLRAGAQLIIPGTATAEPRRYRVRPGDTLIAIARRFGCDLADLLRANALPDPNRLPVGLELLIP